MMKTSSVLFSLTKWNIFFYLFKYKTHSCHIVNNNSLHVNFYDCNEEDTLVHFINDLHFHLSEWEGKWKNLVRGMKIWSSQCCGGRYSCFAVKRSPSWVLSGTVLCGNCMFYSWLCGFSPTVPEHQRFWVIINVCMLVCAPQPFFRSALWGTQLVSSTSLYFMFKK